MAENLLRVVSGLWVYNLLRQLSPERVHAHVLSVAYAKVW
jgi:hypothetical protein